jgi:2-oxoglutarate ferredoxin oxidoreductase subunit alpha
MVQDVRLAVSGKAPVVFWGRPGGGVPTVEQVFDKIKELTVKPKNKK